MDPTLQNLLIQLGVSALVSMFVAWLAATLAARTTLQRFYKERMWERKANAYTTILEALYLRLEWYRQHFDAAITKQTLTEDYAQKLTQQSAEARAIMMRTIEGQTWLLSAAVSEAIEKMDKELDADFPGWEDMLDHSWGAVRDARVTITALARRDLAIVEKSNMTVGQHIKAGCALAWGAFKGERAGKTRSIP